MKVGGTGGKGIVNKGLMLMLVGERGMPMLVRNGRMLMLVGTVDCRMVGDKGFVEGPPPHVVCVGEQTNGVEW